eukprot:CAMPEP_0185035444 /NCGR_PEP_ID=MMETSP1103-20130426/26813_1 /TAXON_ID=36769 /ORGANISM="Paraphysomonas bandaiensis, Strain Caron Lab Isolate" /LENGTH=537 /DNA_ID=CAMNT_0027572527 /DNA_START=34 /DNA_END=1644 /DNA_ORIENTATION=-
MDRHSSHASYKRGKNDYRDRTDRVASSNTHTYERNDHTSRSYYSSSTGRKSDSESESKGKTDGRDRDSDRYRDNRITRDRRDNHDSSRSRSGGKYVDRAVRSGHRDRTRETSNEFTDRSREMRSDRYMKNQAFRGKDEYNDRGRSRDSSNYNDNKASSGTSCYGDRGRSRDRNSHKEKALSTNNRGYDDRDKDKRLSSDSRNRRDWGSGRSSSSHMIEGISAKERDHQDCGRNKVNCKAVSTSSNGGRGQERGRSQDRDSDGRHDRRISTSGGEYKGEGWKELGVSETSNNHIKTSSDYGRKFSGEVHDFVPTMQQGLCRGFPCPNENVSTLSRDSVDGDVRLTGDSILNTVTQYGQDSYECNEKLRVEYEQIHRKRIDEITSRRCVKRLSSEANLNRPLVVPKKLLKGCAYMDELNAKERSNLENEEGPQQQGCDVDEGDTSEPTKESEATDEVLNSDNSVADPVESDDDMLLYGDIETQDVTDSANDVQESRTLTDDTVLVSSEAQGVIQMSKFYTRYFAETHENSLEGKGRVSW